MTGRFLGFRANSLQCAKWYLQIEQIVRVVRQVFEQRIAIRRNFCESGYSKDVRFDRTLQIAGLNGLDDQILVHHVELRFVFGCEYVLQHFPSVLLWLLPILVPGSADEVAFANADRPDRHRFVWRDTLEKR